MIKRNQVFEIKCSVLGCDSVIGCYDNYRTYKRLNCQTCREYCPVPNSPPSHSYCEEHYKEVMETIRLRKLAKGVRDERLEPAGNHV
jgi:hypothetical protein